MLSISVTSFSYIPINHSKVVEKASPFAEVKKDIKLYDIKQSMLSDIITFWGENNKQ